MRLAERPGERRVLRAMSRCLAPDVARADVDDWDVSVHAVVLAAGASSRYGASPPKQAVLLPAVLTALRGAHDARRDRRRARRARRRDRRGNHPLPGLGARAGRLAPLRPRRAAAPTPTPRSSSLADGPDLDPPRSTASSPRGARSGGEAVAASYGGLRLHPVLLARSGLVARSRTKAPARSRSTAVAVTTCPAGRRRRPPGTRLVERDPQCRELLLQLGRHLLVHRLPDVDAQALLEPVAPPAVVALARDAPPPRPSPPR